MNMRRHGLLCVLALAMTACGSRSGQEITICKDTEMQDCTTYPSAAAMNREMQAEEAAEAAKQRRYAASLPFDYRDLMHVALVDYRRLMELPDVDYRYFVSVFGRDIDAPLTTKLHESGIDVLPATAWTQGDTPLPAARRPNVHVKVEMYELKQVAPDTFSIQIYYTCGPGCAAARTYKLQKAGNSWRIVERRRPDLVA